MLIYVPIIYLNLLVIQGKFSLTSSQTTQTNIPRGSQSPPHNPLTEVPEPSLCETVHTGFPAYSNLVKSSLCDAICNAFQNAAWCIEQCVEATLQVMRQSVA